MDAVAVGFLVAFAAFVAAFVVHLFRIGSIYIEFDGRRYWVWQRSFAGNKCHGFYDTEADARASIEKLKRDPPRTINL